MRLNNKGWGTMEMLLLSGGLLIALLVAIFFISKLYGSLDISKREYADLENKIEEAAREYIEYEDILVQGEYKVNLSTLKSNGNIEEFKDSNGNSCNGYVIVSNVDNINHYRGYIYCNDYQTDNY